MGQSEQPCTITLYVHIWIGSDVLLGWCECEWLTPVIYLTIDQSNCNLNVSSLSNLHIPIYFLGLYNSSVHNLIIHYTYLYCCHTTKV